MAAVKPKMFADMEAAAKAMREQSSRRDSVFQQSVEAQKHASESSRKREIPGSSQEGQRVSPTQASLSGISISTNFPHSDDRLHPAVAWSCRGARGVRSLRENTITSFDHALADGCDGFEFDVRRTADGARRHLA